jgi:hypothetical protein
MRSREYNEPVCKRKTWYSPTAKTLRSAVVDDTFAIVEVTAVGSLVRPLPLGGRTKSIPPAFATEPQLSFGHWIRRRVHRRAYLCPTITLENLASPNMQKCIDLNYGATLDVSTTWFFGTCAYGTMPRAYEPTSRTFVAQSRDRRLSSRFNNVEVQTGQPHCSLASSQQCDAAPRRSTIPLRSSAQWRLRNRQDGLDPTMSTSLHESHIVDSHRRSGRDASTH